MYLFNKLGYSSYIIIEIVCALFLTLCILVGLHSFIVPISEISKYIILPTIVLIYILCLYGTLQLTKPFTDVFYKDISEHLLMFGAYFIVPFGRIILLLILSVFFNSPILLLIYAFGLYWYLKNE